MKQKNFLKIALLFIAAISLNFNANAQSTGDIAFVGFNADGDDDFAVVALTDLAVNTKIWFTDSEPNAAGEIETGEGRVEWDSGSSIIKAGTIIIFNDFDAGASRKVSIGSLPNASGSFGLSASGEALYAYTGTSSSVTNWLAGIQNSTSTSLAIRGDLTNTGLTVGSTFVEFTTSGDPDGGVYTGSRSSETSHADYLTEIGNSTNWDSTTGNIDGELILPFSQDSFTITTTLWTGTTSSVWNLASNWTAGVPTTSSIARVISSGTPPVISSGTEAIAGALEISDAAAATLTINAANALTVNGPVTIGASGNLTINSGGSLIVKGSSTGNLSYIRNLPTDKWYLLSSPVVGETGADIVTNSPTISTSTTPGNEGNVAIGYYILDEWTYNYTGTLLDGRGYTIKKDAAGDIKFTGTMQTSDVSRTSILSTNKYNAVGNPYPSYIRASDFLTLNSVSPQDELEAYTLYFWNAADNDYDEVNYVEGLTKYIAPGQGFFVQVKDAVMLGTGDGKIDFKESMQSHQSTDVFTKSSSNLIEIKLKIVAGGKTKNTEIFYIDGTTTGYDNGYDSPIFGAGDNSFALYSGLIEGSNGEQLGIQSLPKSNYEDMVIPVGLNTTSATEITFTANAINLPSGISVFLEDRLLNSFSRLDELNSEYKITLKEAANGFGRFYLHTKTSSVLRTDSELLNSVKIYKTNDNSLQILGLNEGNTVVSLFNMLGKKVLQTSFEASTSNTISLPSLSTGVYIVKLQTASGKLNKKIILK